MRFIKKRYIQCILLSLLVMQLTGCGNNSNKNTSEKNYNSESVEYVKSENVSTDKTVGDEISYDIQDKDILKVTTSCLDTAVGTSLDSLVKNSTQVVAGITRKVSFVSIDGQAWTKVDIEITETLSGDLNKGDIISIYWLGGYIPLSEHIKYFKDENKFSSLSESKKDNTMIQSIVENEAAPSVNENNVYFLIETPSNSPLPKGAYERVSGKSAELNISSDGNTLSRDKSEDYNTGKEEYQINDIKKLISK